MQNNIVRKTSSIVDESEFIKFLAIDVLNLNTKVLNLDPLAFRVHVMALNAAISSFHIGDKGRVLQEMTKIIAEFAEVITKEISNITLSINKFTKQVVVCSNSLNNYNYFNKSNELLKEGVGDRGNDSKVSYIAHNINVINNVGTKERDTYTEILENLHNIILPLDICLDNIFNNIRIGNMISVNIAIETEYIPNSEVNGGLQSLPEELKFLCEQISGIIIESKELLVTIKEILNDI